MMPPIRGPKQAVRGRTPETWRWLGTININTKVMVKLVVSMKTPRSGVSGLIDDEVGGDDDTVGGIGDKVGGVDTSVHGLLPSVLSISGLLVCYEPPSDVIILVICVASDAAPALSPESTLFIEYCTGGPSSTTPVLLELCVSSSDTAPPPYYPACLAPLCLLSCVDPFDTAPPPQDLFAGLAGLLCTAPPPSTGNGSSGSYLPSP
ncbi:uncharacterized protein UHOD_12111 [Ustilago sp. UG-2017b]|nr:uncharacterized protein UHOD_12111 [Ustilago sp. UG-2017b]